MSDFPILLYSSARDIPPLLYNGSLKKVPLSGEATPYKPLTGVPPPRDNDVAPSRFLALNRIFALNAV